MEYPGGKPEVEDKPPEITPNRIPVVVHSSPPEEVAEDSPPEEVAEVAGE